MGENVKVEFNYSRDYKMTHIAGVYGTPTPDGMVMCDFYTERPKVPSEIEIEVDAVSGINREQSLKTNIIQREVQFAMVLPPQKARLIGQWLINTANQAETILKNAIQAPHAPISKVIK